MKTIFERLIHFWNIKSFHIEDDILCFDHDNCIITLDDAQFVLNEHIPFNVYKTYWCYIMMIDRDLSFRQWYNYNYRPTEL